MTTNTWWNIQIVSCVKKNLYFQCLKRPHWKSLKRPHWKKRWSGFTHRWTLFFPLYTQNWLRWKALQCNCELCQHTKSTSVQILRPEPPSIILNKKGALIFLRKWPAFKNRRRYAAYLKKPSFVSKVFLYLVVSYAYTFLFIIFNMKGINDGNRITRYYR